MVMLRSCAVFNILIGTLAMLTGLGVSCLAIGLGGGYSFGAILEVLVFMGPLIIAGSLYVSSGVILWRSLPRVTGKVIWLQGTAWVLCLTYCLIWFVSLEGRFGSGGQERKPGDPFDEEIVMWVFIPAAALLLVAIEFAYLWNKWKQNSD
jgi:hypothetical protein